MYIVASKSGVLRPDAMHLRDWLIAEASSSQPVAPA
jgi:hypothetical protein